VRLVLGPREHDLHGPDSFARGAVFRDQEHPVAGRDPVGDPAPERVRSRPGERRHEADGRAALHAIDEDVGQRCGALPDLLRRELADDEGFGCMLRHGALSGCSPII
jgi:hypothetical protein